jgi:hypothetical protein
MLYTGMQWKCLKVIAITDNNGYVLAPVPVLERGQTARVAPHNVTAAAPRVQGRVAPEQ